MLFFATSYELYIFAYDTKLLLVFISNCEVISGSELKILMYSVSVFIGYNEETSLSCSCMMMEK